MSHMTDIELKLLNEQTILRTELQELKKCQIQYFLLSISATGAVFGFNKELMGDPAGSSIMFLTPLLIILPCWLTFFDKANTITRLTGYMRVFIEDELKKNNGHVYVGYENALSLFRDQEQKDKAAHFKVKGKPGVFRMVYKGINKIKLREIASIELTRHQYWKINWLTFFALALTCCAYPFFKSKPADFSGNPVLLIVYFIFIVAVVIATLFSLSILSELISGKYSYEGVTDYWRQIYKAKFP
jgi:hypothetical protein